MGVVAGKPEGTQRRRPSSPSEFANGEIGPVVATPMSSSACAVPERDFANSPGCRQGRRRGRFVAQSHRPRLEQNVTQCNPFETRHDCSGCTGAAKSARLRGTVLPGFALPVQQLFGELDRQGVRRQWLRHIPERPLPAPGSLRGLMGLRTKNSVARQRLPLRRGADCLRATSSAAVSALREAQAVSAPPCAPYPPSARRRPPRASARSPGYRTSTANRVRNTRPRRNGKGA